MLYQGSDGCVHVLGDGEELKHWKYIKKIKTGSGWRYFYTPEELRQFYNEGKKKVNSIPRLQKHGDKYYIADKKTQKKIDKSGAGGNAFRKIGKTKGVYTLSDKTRNEAWSKEYKRRVKENEGSAFKKANELAKSKAYEGAAKGQTKKYEQYEAKNVTNRKISEIKNKTNKGKSAVEKKLKKVKKTTKNEVEGVKRVTKAINKAGKAKSQGTKYSKNGKTYRNWKEVPSGTFKLYNGKTIGYDYHPKEEKKKKTGKAERAILSVYRKTPKGKRWSLTR